MHHSNGFTHTDVYNMPVYLRRFYLQKLINLKEAEKEQFEKEKSKVNTSSKTFKR